MHERQWYERARPLQDKLVRWRRHLHQNPEIGMDLHQTAAFVEERLAEMGCRPARIGGTGVTALLGDATVGPCVLLRADMDALPIREQSGESFASENGWMHACGHDLHTAMLLGAAQLLKEGEDRLPGAVKLMFQPAEENLLGGKALVEAGILENPDVSAAMMFHVLVGSPYPAGTVIVPGGGPFSSASDWFEIHIRGKGGHGAMPETTVDPLNVACHIHLALQAIQSREVAPDAYAVVTVGVISGGEAPNVIPHTALLKGTVRTYDPAVRSLVLERMEAIVKGVAAIFRAEADLDFVAGCPSVVVDGHVAEAARRGLTRVFGDAVVPLSRLTGHRMTGSEDFAYVSQRVPSVLMQLSAGSPDEGFVHPIHHPQVRFSEDILARGAAAYAAAAAQWLWETRPDG